MVNVFLVEWSVQRHHRLPGSFFNICATPYWKALMQSANTDSEFCVSKNKKVLVPRREQGQKIQFCGTTLFAGKTDRSTGANTPPAQ